MKFEHYLSEARKFVKEVSREIGDPADTQRGERVLTAVLHTLRELLSPEESLHLIAQLPMLIKAVYVNGWHIKPKARIRSMDDFIERLLLQNPKTAAEDFGNDEKAIENTRAVLRVLKRHVSHGEIQHLIEQFPDDLTPLWFSEGKTLTERLAEAIF
jgi:uncharacterized protein (DUF2267 family)